LEFERRLNGTPLRRGTCGMEACAPRAKSAQRNGPRLLKGVVVKDLHPSDVVIQVLDLRGEPVPRSGRSAFPRAGELGLPGDGFRRRLALGTGPQYSLVHAYQDLD